MTGPSSQQLQLQQEQMDFYQEGAQEAGTVFGENQNLMQMMQDVYAPILQAGPNQKGFSGGELENLDTQATEGTASDYAQAARAVAGQEAAEGGGGNPLPAGGENQAKEEVALAAAGKESQEQSQILQADYAQGFKNFENAGQAVEAEASDLNPVAYEGAATGAGNAASETAAAIEKEKESWLAPVLGAVGALGGAALSKMGGGSGSGSGSGSGYSNYGYGSSSGYGSGGYGGGAGGGPSNYGGTYVGGGGESTVE